MYSLYSKSYFTPSQLISHLQTQNLNFKDIVLAEKILKNINYYRFKAYLYPFKNIITKQYNSGVNFEDGLMFYRFDDELRDFLFHIIGRLEIKLRTRLDEVITEFTNNPFWYLDDQYFRKNVNFVRQKLSNEFTKSKDEFVLHFKKSYINDQNDNYKNLPPFWIMMELCTFGDIVNIYDALQKSAFSSVSINILDELAHEFGAKNFQVLTSWLFMMRGVRNKCAHHQRTWNANYLAPKDITPLLTYSSPNANRLYTFMAILHIMEKKKALKVDIKRQLLIYFRKYPVVSRMLNTAGFPVNWGKDPFWD